MFLRKLEAFEVTLFLVCLIFSKEGQNDSALDVSASHLAFDYSALYCFLAALLVYSGGFVAWLQSIHAIRHG